jgi:hypothetical protein
VNDPISPTLTLRKPVVQGSQRYELLTFRDPNGGDLCAAGYPFKLTRDASGDTIRLFDAPAITQLISRLAGVPLSVARAMSVPDWNDGMAIVAGFFDAPEAMNSTDTSPL